MPKNSPKKGKRIQKKLVLTHLLFYRKNWLKPQGETNLTLIEIGENNSLEFSDFPSYIILML